jgi:beta-N-acetylhexosaminidase
MNFAETFTGDFPSHRVGRLFVLGFEGVELTDELVSFASRYGLGGVVLFAKNCPDAGTVRYLCDEIHTRLKDPDDGWTPLVLIDQEGGRVERIKEGVPRLPPAATLAELGVEEIERLASEQSAALKGLGIDVNLAPVCDVVRTAESGVIGDRSFGTSGAEVARNVLAFHRGMQKAGMIGCAKHFPGHGASTHDTHTHTGRVELTLDEVRQSDLVPFGALVAAGAESVGMVMAAHLNFPKIDADPVFLSRLWLQDMLRDELGFGGVIISDDMEMAAAQNEGEPVDVALQALFAGCELLIYGQNLPSRLDPADVAQRLEQALPDHLIEAATQRLWSLRQ